jgi:hypothetical protein
MRKRFPVGALVAMSMHTAKKQHQIMKLKQSLLLFALLAAAPLVRSQTTG